MYDIDNEVLYTPIIKTKIKGRDVKMDNKWARFDDIAKPEEVMEAKAQFEPIEVGVYKMRLEEIKPTESKKGLPMLAGKFRLIKSNRVLFYNQMLQNLNYPHMTTVNVVEAVAFIGQLVGEEIEFTGLGNLGEIVMAIPVNSEYHIEVTYGDKDYEKSFPKLRVVDESEVKEDIDDNQDVSGFHSTSDDIPF